MYPVQLEGPVKLHYTESGCCCVISVLPAEIGSLTPVSQAEKGASLW